MKTSLIACGAQRPKALVLNYAAPSSVPSLVHSVKLSLFIHSRV